LSFIHSIPEKIIWQRYQKQAMPSTVPNGAFFIPERPAFFKTFLHHDREEADESSRGRVSSHSAV
jgi:hypothetical protein